jgi:glycosyltransferase involved in cell wall biosynthesis
MAHIVFVSTNWGAKFGGINSFNYDLCIAVSNKYGKIHDVFCIVPSANLKERENARKNNVRLIEVDSLAEVDGVVDKCFQNDFNKEKEVIWWVGHDVITGFYARDYARAFQQKFSIDCKLAVIHHMDYEAYYGYKSGSGSKTDMKNKEQIHILADADKVFAVGPLLLKSANDKLVFTENKKCSVAKEIIPGLAQIKHYDKALNKFRVISMGRISPETDIVKQGKLGIEAFGYSIKKYHNTNCFNDTVMTILGIEDNEDELETYKRIQQDVSSECGMLINIIPLSYSEDRDDIFNALKSSSVCLMLSLHEGFGLVGWEAIAAGVPLIISRNSGLYRFISNIEGLEDIDGLIYPVNISGAITKKNFTQKDLFIVSEALFEIAKDQSKAKKKALKLKGLLSQYTWDKTAVEFVGEIAGKDKIFESAAEVEADGDCGDIRIMDKKVNITNVLSKFSSLSSKINKDM